MKTMPALGSRFFCLLLCVRQLFQGARSCEPVMMPQLRQQGCYQRLGRNGKRSCQPGLGQVLVMGVGGEHWHCLSVRLPISGQGNAVVSGCYLMPRGGTGRVENRKHTDCCTSAFSINIIHSR